MTGRCMPPMSDKTKETPNEMLLKIKKPAWYNLNDPLVFYSINMNDLTMEINSSFQIFPSGQTNSFVHQSFNPIAPSHP